MHRQLGDACFERLDDVCGRAIVAETGEEHIAGLSLNERRDRRLVFGTDQQVSLPVARHAPLVDLGRALGDRDHLPDSTARVDPAPGAARRAAGPQVRGQLPAQLAARLDIQRTVNRLVTDPHPLIVRMVELQSGRDLLRRPAPL